MSSEDSRSATKRHIADSEARISRHIQLLADMRMRGFSTEDGESLLHSMRANLATMREHLARIDAELSQG